MSINEFLETISFPREFAEEICRVDFVPKEISNILQDVCTPEKYDGASKTLREYFGDDPRGIKIARAFCEAAATVSYENYKRCGISENIFAETMKCFTRFANEHKESFGVYGFERWYWVGRQLSLLLFRIVQLEYELSDLDGERAVSLHIPSDCILSPDEINASLSKGRKFINKYFPDYANGVYYCNSWLLSPALPKLLPESSRIVKFGKLFEIKKTYPEDTGYVQWVYKDKTLSPENFPENTTLQREIKRFVLAGGSIGSALGILKD